VHGHRVNRHKIPPDREIAAVAARQRGVISLEQLRGAGLDRGGIAHRTATGRLHRIHSGVYLVGHAAPMPLALQTAALLACGRGAVLSHRSAGWLWGFVEEPRGPIDVTVVGRDCGTRAGIHIRRVASLDHVDVRRRQRLRVTAPARTILDCAAQLDDRRLRRAIDEALVLRVTTHEELRDVVRRSSGRRGAPRLRTLLERAEGPTFTRSEAEDRLRSVLGEAGIPSPETNVRVGSHEVDMLWRAARLVVEVDGYAFHSTRTAFERDRARDAELQVLGLRVLRITWRQIVDRPDTVIALVAQMLER
jgi:very-short-patch-repair endonuclease/predicted transcriptional regulator of viral defense system